MNVTASAAASPAYRFRIPMPRHVLALGLSSEALACVNEAVGAQNVTHFQDATSLEAQLLTIAEVSVVCSIPSDSRVQLCESIIELRLRFPNVPMVAIFVPSVSSYRAILRLGGAGVSHIVSTEPTMSGNDLMLALSRSHGEGVAIRLWRFSDLSVPEPMVPLLKTALRLAHRPISADQFGDATRMHERSLRKYCALHALPSPQWIIGWARLLIAGYYLDEPGRTVAQVAHMLDFPSTCALRNQLKRYSALPSRALRANGTTLTIARRLEDAVTAHRLLYSGR